MSKRIANKYRIASADPSPDVLRSYIAQQQCWICGKGGWKALSQHLVKKHGICAAEVREMAYMFKYERLISGELSERLSKNALIKFGKRRYIPIKGVSSPKGSLSSKAKDILKKRIKEIRPLAALAQRECRKPHPCPACGKLIETSRPIHCSPECVKKTWTESAKKAMTSERIAFFRTVMYKPTPEEQSEWSKRGWDKIRKLPIEEQKAIFLKRAEGRRRRITKSCVICGQGYKIIPSQASKSVTCGIKECKRQNQRNKSTGRRHKPGSIAKMSAHAKQRHINEPRFEAIKDRLSQQVMKG